MWLLPALSSLSFCQFISTAGLHTLCPGLQRVQGYQPRTSSSKTGKGRAVRVFSNPDTNLSLFGNPWLGAISGWTGTNASLSPCTRGTFWAHFTYGETEAWAGWSPRAKVRKQWSWIESQCVHLTVRAPPITTVPTWAAAVPMQEAAWGQKETPDLLADLAHCPHHQPANVSVHRITTPWCKWLPSRTYQAGWCCCLSRHTASPAKGTGRWR